jgi:hypothetical protein
MSVHVVFLKTPEIWWQCRHDGYGRLRGREALGVLLAKAETSWNFYPGLQFRSSKHFLNVYSKDRSLRPASAPSEWGCQDQYISVIT